MSRLLVPFLAFVLIAQISWFVSGDTCLEGGAPCDFLKMLSERKNGCCEPYDCFAMNQTCVDMKKVFEELGIPSE